MIPTSRTTSAYDVVEAFSDLATTTDRIDTEQLGDALDTIATTFRDTPDETRSRGRRARPRCPARWRPATASCASCSSTPTA